MFSKHHRKYIKQFSLAGMSNPMILGLLSNTTPSKLISSANLWRRWKGSCIKRERTGEKSLSLDLHFTPPPLLCLCLLKSFHSFFFPLLKTLSTIFIYLHTESWASPGHLNYTRGYSTLFTTLLGVYKILLIQVWNRSEVSYWTRVWNWPNCVISCFNYLFWWSLKLVTSLGFRTYTRIFQRYPENCCVANIFAMKSQQPPSALALLLSCISVLRRISFAYHVDLFWLSLLFTRLSAQRINASTFIVKSHRKEANHFRQVLFFSVFPFADALWQN